VNKFKRHLPFAIYFGLVCTALFFLLMSVGSQSVGMFLGVLHFIPFALTSMLTGDAQGESIGKVIFVLLVFCQWLILGFGLSLGLRIERSK